MLARQEIATPNIHMNEAQATLNGAGHFYVEGGFMVFMDQTETVSTARGCAEILRSTPRMYARFFSKYLGSD